MVAVTFGWPDRIEINGGVVGGVRLAMRPDRAPASPGLAGDRLRHGVARGSWGGGEPANGVRRTTLADEGCAMSRPSIFWRPSRGISWPGSTAGRRMASARVQAWMSRATGLGKPIAVEVGDQVRQGTAGLAETGAMRLVKEGVAQTVSLDEAMRVPTWSV